ncbi:MAG TPA: apolipoprotein N-acyltransferase [Acidimicrobiales bacterium]|nr:apolipoprotein N-acyltransferase [Acidimicrobiales bacterium]
MVALSVPPFGFWPLAWVGFAGVALLLPGSSFGSRALLGAGLGLGQYVIGLAWVSEFSIPGSIALMILGGLFGSVALLLVPSARASTVAVGMPAAFVLADWVRAHFPLGGFPLGGTSLGQAVSPLVPTVRLGGSLLLTAETALAGVVIAQLARTAMSLGGRVLTLPARGRKEGNGGSAVALAVAAAVAVGLPIAGWLSPSGQGGRYSPLRVALVQGGGERGTRAIHTDPEVVFQRHIAAASAIRPPVDLVVLPEGVLQTDQTFADTPDGAEVAGLARGLHATVIAGVEQDVGVTHYVNEVAAWSSQGAVAAVYVKNHLVPFGEYVPWRSFISRYFNVSDVPLDAIAGHSSAYLRTPVAPVGVMISYEVFFDDRARSGVRSGGQFLVVPTNTASYRSSQVPAQELAAARLRAWETGRWLLQVTPTGYTAVLTAQGEVVARSTLGTQTVIQAVVPRYDGRTVYVITGDTPWVVAAGFLLIWMALLPRIAGVGSAGEAERSDMPATGWQGQMQEYRSTILLVCTGNQCRSPMAEAILSGLLAERGSELNVESAGLVSEGARCPAEVIAVMSPLGYDLSDHRSRTVNASDIAAAGLIIGMTRQHSIDLSLMAPAARLRTFTLWELVRLGESFGQRSRGESLSEWVSRVGSDRSRSSALNLPLAEDIADPIGKPMRAYTETRDTLLQLTRRLVDLVQPV